MIMASPPQTIPDRRPIIHVVQQTNTSCSSDSNPRGILKRQIASKNVEPKKKRRVTFNISSPVVEVKVEPTISSTSATSPTQSSAPARLAIVTSPKSHELVIVSMPESPTPRSPPPIQPRQTQTDNINELLDKLPLKDSVDWLMSRMDHDESVCILMLNHMPIQTLEKYLTDRVRSDQQMQNQVIESIASNQQAKEKMFDKIASSIFPAVKGHKLPTFVHDFLAKLYSDENVDFDEFKVYHLLLTEKMFNTLSSRWAIPISFSLFLF